MVDVETWVVDVPAATEPRPGPRFGCSMAVYKGGLWVVGGGRGNDLARSGHDLEVGPACLTLPSCHASAAPLPPTSPTPTHTGRVALGPGDYDLGTAAPQEQAALHPVRRAGTGQPGKVIDTRLISGLIRAWG